MARKRTVVTIIAVWCAWAGIAQAEGLGTLIEAGGNMAEIAREQDDQTARFEQVRSAIERGAIINGMTRDTVIAQYGEPVIANTDTETGRDKLVYMPATSDFFKGAKICLYFSGEKLVEINMKE